MKKLNSVLLIDDDEPTNFLNKKLIQELQVTDKIHVAPSGEEALNFLKSGSSNEKNFPCPDLIFLDINMPAMDGWEFLELYNQLHPEQKGKVIIIMLTTSLNPDDEMRARENKEITAFQNKPLTKKIINEIIDTYF